MKEVAKHKPRANRDTLVAFDLKKTYRFHFFFISKGATSTSLVDQPVFICYSIVKILSPFSSGDVTLQSIEPRI